MENISVGIPLAIPSDLQVSIATTRAAKRFRTFYSLLGIITTIGTALIFLPPVQLSQNVLLGLVTLDGLLAVASAAIFSFAVPSLKRGLRAVGRMPPAMIEFMSAALFGKHGRKALVGRLQRALPLFAIVGEFAIGFFALFPPFLAAVLALAAMLRLPDPTTAVWSIPGVLTIVAVWLTIWHAIFLLPYLAWAVYEVRTLEESTIR